MVQNLMDVAEDKFSIKQEPIRRRVINITISIGIPSAERLENQVKEAASCDASYDNCLDLA
jgi:hypothetical protein